MFTYFNTHIPILVYILLRSYAYICLHILRQYINTWIHTATPINDLYKLISRPINLYIFTYFYANIRPIYAYIFLLVSIYSINNYTLLRPYRTYACLRASRLIHLYQFTHIHAHIPMHEFILLRPYNYTCLHNSSAAFLCMFTYFYAYTAIHFEILLRQYTFTWCELLRPYTPSICLHSSRPIYILYTFTYFYARICHIRI
jgi:hypothetical protein